MCAARQVPLPLGMPQQECRSLVSWLKSWFFFSETETILSILYWTGAKGSELVLWLAFQWQACSPYTQCCGPWCFAGTRHPPRWFAPPATTCRPHRPTTSCIPGWCNRLYISCERRRLGSPNSDKNMTGIKVSNGIRYEKKTDGSSTLQRGYEII